MKITNYQFINRFVDETAYFFFQSQLQINLSLKAYLVHFSFSIIIPAPINREYLGSVNVKLI